MTPLGFSVSLIQDNWFCYILGCAKITLPFANISDMDAVNFINFHRYRGLISRSWIIKISNHGPNLVPCVTPDELDPTRNSSLLPVWPSVLYERGVLLPFEVCPIYYASRYAQITHTIKVECLTVIKYMVLIVVPLPSVLANQWCNMLINAMVVDEFGIAPYGISTINSSDTLENRELRENREFLMCSLVFSLVIAKRLLSSMSWWNALRIFIIGKARIYEYSLKIQFGKFSSPRRLIRI